MVIRVLNDRSIVKDADPYGTQNENQVTTLNFVIPEEYASFNKKIVFITPNGVYWDLITNDTYIIKNNVTKYRNVSAYVWLVDVENQIDFRTKIFYIDFNQNTNPDNFIPSSEEISGYDTMIAELNELIQEVEDLGALHYEIVEELPTEDIDPTAVYLILREESEPNNIYDEWMYIENAWEKIGSTDVDLQPLQKEINEINEMLFTHTTAESVNQEVSLNGNPNLEMNVTELDGRTEQDSTKGYNLLPSPVSKSETSNGVTFNTDGKGKYTISGKLTNASNTNQDFPINKKYSAGTYYWHLRNSGTTTAYINIGIRSNNSTISYLALSEINRINSFTLAEETTIDNIRLTVGSGYGTSDSIDITLEPTIELTGDTTDFEKYTNGASPNPDYKQDIHVVTGTQDVVVSGKNKFNINATPTLVSVDSYSVDGSKFTQTNSSQYGYARTEWFIDNLKVDKQYTLNFKFINPNASAVQGRIYNSANNSLVANTDYTIATTGTLSTTFTATETSCYLRLYSNTLQTANGYSVTFDEIQLEQNSSATPYEPYITPTSYQLSLGDKELFEDSYIERDSNGDWYFNDSFVRIACTSDRTWYKSVSTAVDKYYSRTQFDYDNSVTGDSIGNKCTHFRYKNNSAIVGEWNYNQNNDKLAIFFNFAEYNTSNVNSFKAWLDSANMSVVVKSPTIIKTPITDTTLIEQLNAIQKLQQLNGTTIVSIEGNLGADFKLVYENDSISDLNTRVGNIEADYVKSTDYASNSKGGVIKVDGGYALQISTTGQLRGLGRTSAQYQSLNGDAVICKTTLDNVLSATIGDINSLLDEINGEVI